LRIQISSSQNSHICKPFAYTSAQSRIFALDPKAQPAAAMSANVLSSRDANAQVLKSSPETKDAKPKTLDYQREMLNKKLNGNK
jgi:hypothetical protein